MTRLPKRIIGRQELKARAFEAAWNAGDGQVTKELIEKYEREFRKKIFGQSGEVIDISAEYAGKEAALQLPLTGVWVTRKPDEFGHPSSVRSSCL